MLFRLGDKNNWAVEKDYCLLGQQDTKVSDWRASETRRRRRSCRGRGAATSSSSPSACSRFLFHTLRLELELEHSQTSASAALPGSAGQLSQFPLPPRYVCVGFFPTIYIPTRKQAVLARTERKSEAFSLNEYFWLMFTQRFYVIRSCLKYQLFPFSLW